MSTIFLRPDTWDWCLNASGDIAVATGPYALAQDAASAIRLFLGEYYFDISLGTPYFQTTFGQIPNLQLIKAQCVAAALTVEGVDSAVCFIASVTNRQVTGQVQITSTNGKTAVTGFSS